ncbi:alpha/beta hydrolase [Cytobacillus sp. S13-E01]|uniref:alpha/beta fold hydrolase n=1 Tax=Cytobacillus sp. S13-E01 TaxID=3031326 RepID=UPI0023D842AD|nr:alpha/beta hydrolase [Cytobacillus sp. S13-E01]MDF0729034.1 alpha/beta hydrolase [Cytobacillus sp. S13-E01]
MKIETPNHFKIQIQNVNIHYEFYQNISKSSPTFILIHGFLSSTFSYRRLIPLLSEDHSVLALDLPPFGQSEKSTTFTYSYKNMASIVEELIIRLKLSNVILVGHSMGGQIALNVARKRPDLVEKIVLLSSSGYMKRSSTTLIYSSYIPFFHRYVKRYLGKQGVERNLLNVVHDHSLIDEAMRNGYLQPFNDDKIFMALTRMIRHREGDLESEELQKIKTPSLLLWGQEDKVVPVTIGKRLQQDLPISTFISFDKTGHLVPEEKPLHVYENILHFIDG